MRPVKSTGNLLSLCISLRWSSDHSKCHIICLNYVNTGVKLYTIIIIIQYKVIIIIIHSQGKDDNTAVFTAWLQGHSQHNWLCHLFVQDTDEEEPLAGSQSSPSFVGTTPVTLL